jgi:NTP pyrophosphatase (non-canonical NTP hydrolase)
MDDFNHYLENRTEIQLKFLRAINESGTESEAIAIVKAMLQQGNEELLEVIGVATIIAQSRNQELEAILSDERSEHTILKKYHAGGSAGDAIAVARNMFKQTFSLSTV